MQSGKTQKLTWDELNQYAKNIAGRISHTTHIIAIGGGGIIPAGLIAYHYYRIYGRHIQIRYIYAASYTDRVQRDATISWPSLEISEDLRRQEDKVLIVDDISDTGNTLIAFKDVFPKAKTATIIYRHSSSVIPNYWGHSTKELDWFVFPWER
jgi:xanthine phosphoribosyltransferase